jgi:hypothetical protein
MRALAPVGAPSQSARRPRFHSPRMPRRKRKRFARPKLGPSEIRALNQRWGMDFVRDSLVDGRSFRALRLWIITRTSARLLKSI